MAERVARPWRCSAVSSLSARDSPVSAASFSAAGAADQRLHTRGQLGLELGGLRVGRPTGHR